MYFLVCLIFILTCILSIEKENFNVFTDLLNPIEESQVPLESTWGVTRTLFFGDSRRMYGHFFPNIDRRIRTAFGSKYCNKKIFEACKNALEDKNSQLTKEQERLLEKFILEGKLNGLDLKSKKSQELIQHYAAEIAKEQTLFSTRIQVISLNRNALKIIL